LQEKKKSWNDNAERAIWVNLQVHMKKWMETDPLLGPFCMIQTPQESTTRLTRV